MSQIKTLKVNTTPYNSINYLANNPPNTNDIAGILSGKTLGAQIGTVSLTPISLILNGVQLSSQNTIPNCYGGLKFC